MPYVQKKHHEGKCPVCGNYHQLDDRGLIPYHHRRANGFSRSLIPCEGWGEYPFGKVREHEAVYYQAESGEEKRI